MNPPLPSAILESYVRTPDFEDHAATLELSPALWDIFALTENRVTAAAVARELGIEAAAAHLGLRELAGHRLVRQHVQSWRDYRSATPAPAARPPETAAPVPTHVTPVPATPPPAPAPAVAATPVVTAPVAIPVHPVAVSSAPKEIRFAVTPPGHRRQAATPSGVIRLSLRRTTPPPAAAVPPTGSSASAAGWRLRPILDAISRHGGGTVTGQLLAYRVFLGIPGELLDRAGLYSLSLTANDFTIRDPEFYAALRHSVREVAGLELATIDCAVEPSVPALP